MDPIAVADAAAAELSPLGFWLGCTWCFKGWCVAKKGEVVPKDRRTEATSLYLHDFYQPFIRLLGDVGKTLFENAKNHHNKHVVKYHGKDPCDRTLFMFVVSQRSHRGRGSGSDSVMITPQQRHAMSSSFAFKELIAKSPFRTMRVIF